MKLNTIIKDYFTFNRREQRGLFILLSIFFLLVIANEVIPVVVKPGVVDQSGFEREVAAFERSVSLADSAEKLALKSGPHKAGSGGDSSLSGKSYPKENFIIELNTADTFALQRLRGIGPSFARRIVSYRERLGGYSDRSQLLEIWGMDTTRYNVIKEHLTVNPGSVQPIDLNTVTFKKLLAHPYFPFEITKAIMIYRKEHKKFVNVEELKKVEVISDSIYRKIKIYVKVE